MSSASKFFLNLGRGVKEFLLPVVYSFRKDPVYVPLSGRSDGVVVSLTTFPARIGGLWIVIDSLMRQSVRPDKIVIVLTEEEFPEGEKSLPESLARLKQFGVEVVFMPENLRCHNKYWHALSAYPDATVVTVDDDCCYRRDALERLLKMHEAYPEAVCCNIAACIDLDDFYHYKSWRKSTAASEPSLRNVALGFAGVLYPQHFADRIGTELFDKALVKELAPISDDLWLKAVETVHGVKVACGSLYPKPVTISGSQKISLRSMNKGAENRNDTQWKALDEHFHLKDKI